MIRLTSLLRKSHEELPPAAGKRATQRVSARTLVLMLELLTAVVALQYISGAHSPRRNAVWLLNGRSAADEAADLRIPADAAGSGANFFAEPNQRH